MVMMMMASWGLPWEQEPLVPILKIKLYLQIIYRQKQQAPQALQAAQALQIPQNV